jgi:hypothetical protein
MRYYLTPIATMSTKKSSCTQATTLLWPRFLLDSAYYWWLLMPVPSTSLTPCGEKTLKHMACPRRTLGQPLSYPPKNPVSLEGSNQHSLNLDHKSRRACPETKLQQLSMTSPNKIAGTPPMHSPKICICMQTSPIGQCCHLPTHHQSTQLHSPW